MPEEEIRCGDTVAPLLLEGKKGNELAQVTNDFNGGREAQLKGSASPRTGFGSVMTPPPFFNPLLQTIPHHASGLFLRRPSSVPLPSDAWLGGFGSNMSPAPAQYSTTATALALPPVPFIGSSHPVSPSPIPGHVSFVAQQQQQYQERLLLRRPSSAQPIGVWGRRSWATMYDGHSAMPFFQDLGIENPFAPQHHQLPDGEADMAGEPNYTLFSNFSFSRPNEAAAQVVSIATYNASEGSTSESINIAPHDVSHTLNLPTDPWTPRDALHSATSFISSSSTTTIGSQEFSTTPSYMYAPDNVTMLTGQSHIYLPTTASYNMNFTPFDISPLDPLSMPYGYGAE